MMIDYKCKFCGMQGSVSVDDGNLDMIDLSKWTPMLCCNRCADYLEKKRSLMDRIRNTVIQLMNSRLTAKGEKLDKIESSTRETFAHLTKRFATLVCEYYHKPNVWDSEFVQILMDKPDKFWLLCRNYAKSVQVGHL